MRIGYVIANREFAEGRASTGYLYREPPERSDDGGWRLFVGDETQTEADEPENFAMYNASTVFDRDPALFDVLHLETPVSLERTENGQFRRLEAVQEEK
ncbi:MAG: DUF2185 domain-containing protein [Myxococcota bacterium]